ncbi:MAG: helix-turn-helix domain-containing protein [Desulfobacterales bacterium]
MYARNGPTYFNNIAGERDNLLKVLRQVNGNQSIAARALGVSRVTIWKRIKKYGVNLDSDLAE